METISKLMSDHGFSPNIRSADGNMIHFIHLDCHAGVTFINVEGTLRFKVAGFLPQSTVQVSTEYHDWANREKLLWMQVKHVHMAIESYKRTYEAGNA